jgi:hypothetical protein
MQIQINNLAAIERLIGGDSQLELDIRNNIVQKFAEKHLKPLVNDAKLDALFAKVTESYKEEAKKIIGEKLGKFKTINWRESFVLNDNIKMAIRQEAQTKIMEQVDAAAQAVTEKFTPEYFDKLISKRVDDEVNRRIREGVVAKLDEVTKKLV